MCTFTHIVATIASSADLLTNIDYANTFVCTFAHIAEYSLADLAYDFNGLLAKNIVCTFTIVCTFANIPECLFADLAYNS